MATLRTPVTREDHIQGSEGAEITLVEYGDYECPHCGRAHPIVKRIQKHFGKRLRFVFRNFPMSRLHPHAEDAAEAAEFAAAQGQFWEMHDLLFENQQRLGQALYVEIAEDLKLSSAAVHQALETRQYAARVRADFDSGVRSGVNGTPTFFINGNRYDRPVNFNDLVLAIEETVGRAKSAVNI